tara:strand:- start:3707 stop:4819 length:1113 start_codon:yes stop_codon:yes gene_type:complete
MTLALFIYSCATSNATTMEFRTATTAVRSERDFKKGEEYALKALDMETHANDAKVAYFLAIEIYKPRKKWEEMNTMLDLALSRNEKFKSNTGLDQPLDRPLVLEDRTVIRTIAEAIPVYKEQVWMNVFNQAVDLIEQQNFDKAIKKITLAKKVSERIENYNTSTLLFLEKGDDNKAKEELEKALSLDPENESALKTAGDIAFKESNLKLADEYYQKVLKKTSNDNLKNEIIETLVYVNVELKKYEEAIEYSKELLENNMDNPDIYYNVGVIHQRLATEFYDSGNDDYKTCIDSDKIDSDILNKSYKSFNSALRMTELALDYFMDASMLEVTDNSSTKSAIDDMKRLRKNIKNIYIPSLEQMSSDNNINLN